MNGAVYEAARLVLPRIWAMVEAKVHEPAPAPQVRHRCRAASLSTADRLRVGLRRRAPSCRTGLRLVASRATSAEASVAQRRVVRAELKLMPDLVFYRRFTEALLLRYMSMSLEAGRVPSLMGREMFRANVSHCRVTGFDDVVHFVHDFASCLDQLSAGRQHLLRRIGMQGYTQAETSAMLGVSLSTTIRHYNEALDQLTCVLLARGILKALED